MPRTATWIAVAALAAAGYLARGDAPARLETRETARVVPIAVGGGAAAGPSLDELRAMIREEVARSAPPAPVAEEPAPAAYEAVDAAVRHLDGARARGVWTEDDRLAFRDQVSAAPPLERGRLMAALARALNDGVRMETEGSPLY